ncbi:gliding motility-associated C-terminal domain-containing protein [Fulvivirgaceae bacterium BMA12]|uniref:Gliding motility-associated C-terminal domain-containing protein n=1 Tax=Agaribacillus aureus TaxID=3051825 RepID=A0ABT8L835_9BACT|nr:gliding motility-associated C-terminal domain-containing protein [Fulvivirgaceae bacterium BMA12]
MKKCVIRSLWVCFIIVLFNGFDTQAATYTTVGHGSWNDPLVWDLGAVPSPGDDIIINHLINAATNIAIGPAGTLNIGLSGRLTFGNLQLVGFLRNDGTLIGDQLDLVSGGPIENMQNYGRVRIANVTLGPDTGGGGSAITLVSNYNRFHVTGNLTIRGFFLNQRTLAVDGRLINHGRLRSQAEYSLIRIGLELSNTASGQLELEGKIKLGLWDNDGNPVGGTAFFVNDGSFESIAGPGAYPGIFDGGSTVTVTNNNTLVGDLFLCIGPQSSYENTNPPDDFIIDCCVAQIANAGPDRVVCSGANITLGGTPTVIGGNGPYDYVWTSIGGNLVTTTNPNPQAFTNVNAEFFVTVEDNTGCVSKDIVNITPTTSLIAWAGPDKYICEGETVPLGGAIVASCDPGTYTYEWSPSTGLDDPTAPNPNASPTTTTHYQVEVTSSTSSVSYDVMTVYVAQQPTVANAGVDKNVCGTSTNLEGNAPTVGNGIWSIVTGIGGNIANRGSNTSNFTGTLGATYLLRWTINNGSCISSQDVVEITFDDNPTTANAGPDQSLCGTSTTLAANTPTVGIGTWNIVSGAGGNITTLTDENSSFTGTAGTTYRLRWTISNGSCTSSQDDVEITFYDNPTIANAGPDQNLCGTSTTLAANAPTIGTGTWSIISGTGGSITTLTDENSSFSGTAGTTYQLRWTISNGSCTSSQDDVTITFNQEPTTANAGSNRSICGTSIALEGNAAVVGTGTWSVISGSGGSFTDVNVENTTFSGIANTVYQLRWTITTGTCTSQDDVTINLNQVPTGSDAGPDKSVCGTSTTLDGNVAVSGTGTWSVISGLGGSITDVNDENSNFTGTPGTTYRLRWTISAGACSSSDDVDITFDPAPTIANAGADKSVCGSSTNLEGNTPATGTGTWSIISGAGGGFANANDENTNFTGTAGITYQLRWTIISGGCSSQDDVTITLDQAPTVANAGADKNVCGTATNLEANTAAIGTGTWSIISGIGGIITDLNDENSNFSGTVGSTYQLRWTISNGSCPDSQDDVTITFDQTPTIANAGVDKNICGTSTSLEGITATIGTGTWSIISGIGGSITDLNDENSNFTGTAGTTYQLRWTISNGGCPSSQDDVNITFDQSPTTANAGADKSVCGTSTNLEANTATVGTGTWTIISGTGGGFTNVNDENTNFTGTAGTTYQLRWTISSGSCTSSADDVFITFDQTPTVANAGPDKNVCGSTNLDGNTAAIGTGTWTIVSGTGGNITTPNAENSNFSGTAGATYRLRWTISNGSCTDSWDEVDITFDQAPTTANAGTDKNVCGSTNLEGNAATVGTGTWSIISGAGGSFVNANDENTSFTGTAGTTYQLRWTISNGSCTDSQDDVNITFDQPPTTADAGADKSVCGTATNLEGNTAAVGTGTWSIISGGGGWFVNANDENTNFTGTAGTTYQLRWTISNGSCTSFQDDVNITFDQSPTVANAGADKNVCGSTNLEGNIATVGTGTWSIVSGLGGSITDLNDESSNFTGTPGTTYQLRWTISNGSCPDSWDHVNITFDPPPTIANAGTDKSVCGNATNLEGNTASTGTGTWSIISGAGGGFANVNAENSNFTGTPGTTYQLRWTISNGSCPDSQDDVNITFDQVPTVANAGADKSVCGASTNLEGNVATVGTGTWSVVSGLGGSVTNLNDENSNFTGTPGTTYQLRWTISNGSCASSQDDVTITLDQSPTVANAGTDKSACGTSTNLEANTPAVGSGMWSIVSGLGGNIITPNNRNSTFTGIVGTTYQLRWTISNGTCADSQDDVTITFDETPTISNAGMDKSICGTSTSLEGITATVGAGTWSIISGLGGSITTPTDQNTNFTGTPGTTYQLRWTISNGSCPDSQDDVNITFDQTPTTANAGTDKSACGNTTNLEANTATIGTGTWSIISGAGGSVTSVNDPTSNFSGTPGNSYQLRWTISNGSCTSSADDVNITFDQLPTTANAGADKSICGTSTNLDGNTVTIGTGTWSVVSGIGGNITNLNDPNSAFTGVAGTTYQLRWTIANGSCADSQDDVNITFDQTPTTANAGADKSICGTSTNLEANAATVGTGTWSIVSGAGGSVAIPNDENSAFTGIAGTIYQLRWTISNGSCASSQDDVIITLDQTPTTANAGADQNVCGTSTNLEANNAAVGTGLWSIISGVGGSITNNNDATSNFTGVIGTTYQLRWTISNGSCVDSQDDVIITFDETPTTADAGADQNICGTSTSLTGNTAAIGTGSWSIISGSGGSITNINDENSDFTGTAGTTYQLRWTISNGSCTGSQDDVTITFDQTPTTANAGPDQNICGTSTNLEGNIATIGIGSWSIISGTGGSITNINDENSNFTGVIGTTYQLRWTINNGSCPESRDDVSITFNPTPVTANAGPDQAVCGTATTLEGNDPNGAAGSWSVVSGDGLANFTNQNLFNTNFSGTAGQTYVIRWTINSALCGTSTDDEVTVTFDEAPLAADAGNDIDLCGNVTTTTLNGNTPSVGTGTWRITAGPGNIANPNLASTAIAGLVVGQTTTVEWQIVNGSCRVADEMSINVRAAASVNINSAEICEGESVDIEITGGSSFRWNPEDGVSNPNTANPQLSPTASTNYELTVSNGTCSDQIININVVVNPLPIVRISNDTTIQAGNSVQLFASGGDLYSWSPTDDLDNPQASDPFASPIQTTTYTVEVENEFGCAARESVTVTVDDNYEIFVPQMFTPNGDGSNDILFVNTIGIETLTFKIFDRHGKLIFESASSSDGWDGRVNGEAQNIDTYVYLVSARTYSNQNVTDKGTFQLIR